MGLTEIREIWYGRYAIGVYSKLILFTFLLSVISTWRMLKVVRCNDYNAITYDLSVRVTNLT
jgi:hypothetical protein